MIWMSKGVAVTTMNYSHGGRTTTKLWKGLVGSGYIIAVVQ